MNRITDISQLKKGELVFILTKRYDFSLCMVLSESKYDVLSEVILSNCDEGIFFIISLMVHEYEIYSVNTPLIVLLFGLPNVLI